MNPREDDFEEEKESFLPNSRDGEHVASPHSEDNNSRWRRVIRYLRLPLELLMGATILFLLFRPQPHPSEQTLRRTPVPRLPRKIYKFTNNTKYIRDDMFLSESSTLHTLHTWIEFTSASRGYVHFPSTPSTNPTSDYDLPTPYTIAIDRHTDGPGYMVSVFHQLHCLSYLAEHYQQGYAGTPLSVEVAHHSAHCFNYLRQGIMCNADTTLEGKTEEGPGEGSEHECVDYDALLEWANGHAGMKWREGLLPEDSTL